jgi:hypothetical protein
MKAIRLQKIEENLKQMPKWIAEYHRVIMHSLNHHSINESSHDNVNFQLFLGRKRKTLQTKNCSGHIIC